MTLNPYAARAMAASQVCHQAVIEGRLTQDLAYAVMASELLNLSMDAHAAGDLETSGWLFTEASIKARNHRVEIDVARAGNVPDSPAGLLGATESAETPEPVPETPPEQNEELERD